MTVDGQFTRNTEGQTLFCQELNDTVYVCDEQGAHVRYIFDFGDNTMTPEKKLEYMEALVLFCTSKTHEMLENEDCGMTMFGAGGIFNIWECEKITGDPRNSVYIRGE